MNQDQEDRERWRDDGGWVNTSEEKVTKPDRRKHARTEDLEDLKERLPTGQPSQEEEVIRSEERRSLEGALATLPADDREVLALYYVQKRTTKEIAEVMGVAPGTIMARLFRAREKLRKQMKPEEEP